MGPMRIGGRGDDNRRAVYLCGVRQRQLPLSHHAAERKFTTVDCRYAPHVRQSFVGERIIGGHPEAIGFAAEKLVAPSPEEAGLGPAGDAGPPPRSNCSLCPAKALNSCSSLATNAARGVPAELAI